jgi:hypothetical protein
MGIVLNWRGAEYRIPDERAFEAGERLEDVVTLGELMAWGNAPKFHKLARCFATLLRFAGCKVSDREVLGDMMAQIKDGGAEGEQLVAAQAVASLIAVLMDGAPASAGGEAPAGKTTAS